MPRYYFDIKDGGSQVDEIGTVCSSDEDVHKTAMRALPDIAAEEIQADGDRRFFTVVVRDENLQAVYTATLSFAGIWLKDRPKH